MKHGEKKRFTLAGVLSIRAWSRSLFSRRFGGLMAQNFALLLAALGLVVSACGGSHLRPRARRTRPSCRRRPSRCPSRPRPRRTWSPKGCRPRAKEGLHLQPAGQMGEAALRRLLPRRRAGDAEQGHAVAARLPAREERGGVERLGRHVVGRQDRLRRGVHHRRAPRGQHRRHGGERRAASYDVLRWDGTCASLQSEEVSLKPAPRPRRQDPLEDPRSTRSQNALLRRRESRTRSTRTRRKECKGASMGDVSLKCVKADEQLSVVVVDFVRQGGTPAAARQAPLS